jgi:5'(3')-deoxyribonucleotidase
MRLFEVENQLASRPIVYVDMDGVLADFFGEVARVHKVRHWKDIKGGDLAIVQSAGKKGFFAGLPKLKNADDLVRGVKSIAGQYSILSSPLQSNVEQSSEEKSDWLRKHYTGALQPQSMLFDHEKFRYAKQSDETPNILIDDYPVNIRLWNAHGGIGLLYDSKLGPKAVLAQLRDAMAHPEKYLNPVPKTEDIREGRDHLFTNLDVLKYVKDIHHRYRLDDPIRKVKAWRLDRLPTRFCSSPEHLHQDDPYRREIHLDMEHIDGISLKDIMTKPVVCDANGWVLDGNHRVTRAREMGLELIPILVPAV